MQAQTTADFARSRRSSLIAAIFLMATSAIGPGFITQTATFTATMGAAFAFGILASILIDFVVQLNVWRIVTLTRMRASDLANAAIPGSGYLLAVLVIFGGLVFNVGNIAGAGLGLNALMGLDPKWGGGLSALVAIGIFLSKRAGIAVDRLIVVLGLLMILLTLFVAIASNPPLGEALRQTVWPDTINFATITTIVGGTVGGYITFAGAHRLIDSGHTGVENVKNITYTSVSGIVVTGIMRMLLFLAVLGVVATGVALSDDNTAADAFYNAAGEFGLRAFGVVLFAAGLSSVIGAAYTSVSFVTSQDTSTRTRNILTIVFIAVCTVVFVAINSAPQKLLIFAGAINGLILPIGFALVMWVAWRRRDLLQGYKYPKWLLIIGTLAWVLTIFIGFKAFSGITELWA